MITSPAFVIGAHGRYACSENIWEKKYYAEMTKLLLEWKADTEMRDIHAQVICIYLRSYLIHEQWIMERNNAQFFGFRPLHLLLQALAIPRY